MLAAIRGFGSPPPTGPAPGPMTPCRPTGLLVVVLFSTAFLTAWLAVPGSRPTDPVWVETPQLKLYEGEIERLYHMGDVEWPAYLASLNADNLAPLTKEFQEWFWHHQHPTTCGDKRFLVSAGWWAGLGSALHVAGYHMAVAIELGAIYIMDPGSDKNGAHYVDDGCGRGLPFTTFECVFQPLSSCDISHAGANNSWVARDYQGIELAGKTFESDLVPAMWKERLQKHLNRKLTDAFYKYWWRAQSIAYIARLNNETSRQLLELRLNQTMNLQWEPGSGGVPVAAPFPLPKGTISMHVRHGDKAVEMSLVPFDTFVAAADRLVRENPLFMTRKAFVSTEDESVISEAADLPNKPADLHTTSDTRWTTFTSSIPRLNDSPYAQVEAFGRTRMTTLWLLQLFMALECDAYVGTRGSNWNRMIDELRCVWVSKCNNVYIEVGSNWDDYGW